MASGYELAVAAALGGRLRAAVVPDVIAGGVLLDSAGADGGSAVVAGAAAGTPGPPPVPGAEPLADRIAGDGDGAELARALLADAWVVERLEDVPGDFAGIAVTRPGRAWFGAARELRQAPEGGEDRVLAERNRRDDLLAATERAHGAERTAGQEAERASAAVAEADAARAETDRELRAAVRERDASAEEVRRVEWLIEQRRTAPDEGPSGLRRAEVEAALAAERRLAEQAEHARAVQQERLASARAQLERCRALGPAAERLVAALEAAETGIGERVARAGGRAERRPRGRRGPGGRAARLRPSRGRPSGSPARARRSGHRRRGGGPAGARPGGRGAGRADRARGTPRARRRARGRVAGRRGARGTADAASSAWPAVASSSGR